MNKDIKEFLRNCETCLKTKIIRNSPNLLTPSLVCSKTHQWVHLDIIAAPVASGNNNRYILSFTEFKYFSNYVELMAIFDRTPKLWQKLFSPDGKLSIWSTNWNHHQPRERILHRSHIQVVQGNETETRSRMSVFHILFPRENGK